MHLIQLHSCFHGENGAADSTAFSFFHSGGVAAWGRLAQTPQNEKNRMLSNQLHNFLHGSNYAAESTALFSYF